MIFSLKELRCCSCNTLFYIIADFLILYVYVHCWIWSLEMNVLGDGAFISDQRAVSILLLKLWYGYLVVSLFIVARVFFCSPSFFSFVKNTMKIFPLCSLSSSSEQPFPHRHDFYRSILVLHLTRFIIFADFQICILNLWRISYKFYFE